MTIKPITSATDSITIDYLEDDKSGSFALPLSVLQEEDVNYLFNNWMEL